MKKLIALFMAICFLTVSLSSCKNSENSLINSESLTSTMNEQNKPTEPNPASDFEYQVNSAQTGILINKYVGSSSYVIIPSHIDDLPVLSLKGVPDEQYPTSIAEGVFEDKDIQSVVIPETIKVIGYKCFYNCQSLTSFTVAANSALTYINGRAFENCAKIEEIDLRSTQLKEIDSLAFRGCTNLKDIMFADTLEKIREKAFYGCSSLLNVDFPESLIEIQGGAFAYCSSLKKIEIPTKLGLTSLNEPIFHDVPNLETVVFKEGREEIVGYAFIQTDASIAMIVPDGVKKFSSSPFLITPSSNITITFLGDAPEIVEDDAPNWFGNPIVYYDSNKDGWETFDWKDKVDMNPLPQN